MADALHFNTHGNATKYLLDLLVDNYTNSMLGYIVDTSCLAMIALMRHSFLNGTCALKDITCNNVTTVTTTAHFTISQHKLDPKFHLLYCLKSNCQSSFKLHQLKSYL